MIRDVIRRLRDDGVAVVLTTHELDEAARLADRIVIIDHGRVVADGTPGELTASGAGSDIRFGAPPGIDVDALSVRDLRQGDRGRAGRVPRRRRGHARAGRGADVVVGGARASPLGDLRAGRQTLEDVFLRLTGDTGTSPVLTRAEAAEAAPGGVTVSPTARSTASGAGPR